MNLKMTGIDYTRAGIDIRQRFSFTRTAMAQAMEQMRQTKEIRGCVMISTCNRMELWLSLREGAALELTEFLCRWKGLSVEKYQEYFVEREGEEAVRHLFYLSAGMKSQIVGEDQILTQVGEALAFAREQACTDRVLEVLFRMAVTAGKRVKSSVVIDKANVSAAHQAVDFLRAQEGGLVGRKCLVIGNGMMGKLTAQALMEEGADVTVTVRQYKSGLVEIPAGAKRIDYGERYRYIPACELIVSATASPNTPITKDRLRECLAGGKSDDMTAGRGAVFGGSGITPALERTDSCGADAVAARKKQIYVDLAVPRDMEPSIAELAGVKYYDMDSLPIRAQSPEMHRQYRRAEEILSEEIREFLHWQECRDLTPRIQEVGKASAKELVWRMERPFRELPLSDADREKLKAQLEQTAAKVIDRLLFELRDESDSENLTKVIEILEQVYQERNR